MHEGVVGESAGKLDSDEAEPEEGGDLTELRCASVGRTGGS